LYFQALLNIFVVTKLSMKTVRNGAKKLAKARTGTTQGRLDSFFKVLPSTNTTTKRKVSAVVAKFNGKFTLYLQTKCSIISTTLLIEVWA
jgi:hypothetical protein